jgi:solute carrier family 35 protein E1
MVPENQFGQKSGLSKSVRIFVLCLVWYSASSASNVINKTVLNDFPYAVTVSLAQYIVTLLCVTPLIRIWKLPRVSFTSHMLKWTIIPLSFGKFFSLATSHFSISKVPVSFAHTIKASLPIFVLLLSRVIWGEKHPPKIYLSVVPIFVGIGMATISELNFNLTGTISAFASTIGYALQNLYTKKTMRDLNIHQHVLLQNLTLYGVFMMFGLWCFTDAPTIMQADHANRTYKSIAFLLVCSGLMALVQNLVAFSVMALMTTVSYSVASATKRVVVIVVSLLMLKNPVTPFNVSGMIIASCGVFLYNRIKVQVRKATPLLPSFSATRFA